MNTLASESRSAELSHSSVKCHVLCGGASVDLSTFTNYQRLLVNWQTKRAYTMEEWSDDKVRSGIVPLIVESHFDDEDQWCVSRGLTKIGLAIHNKAEIDPHLPISSTAAKVAVRQAVIGPGQTQTWSARGFSSNSVVRVSMRFDGDSIVLPPDRMTDARGEVQGAFMVGTNIPAGVVILAVESASDPTLYGETRFTVELLDRVMTLRYSSARFRIQSDVAYDISWFFQYIESVYDQLRINLGHEPSQYLPIKCTIRRGSPGGIGGWTAGGEMGVEAENFKENRWCLVISAQELVNLFTGSICSGWPSDWWANHKSPFPIMVAVEVVRDLGYAQQANDYDIALKSDQLYVWHKNVKTTFGWKLYRSMFSAMKADGIQWDHLESNPSKILTNYVLAYMGIGAEGIRLPSTSGAIPNADERIIEGVIRARQKLQTVPRRDQKWTQYLNGEYLILLKS